MVRHLLSIILCGFVAAAPAPGFQDSEYRLTVDVQLVQLPVSVSDKKGNPFHGLRQNHFAVYEDRILQDISLFMEEDVPLSVGLVIDTSNSMKNMLDNVDAAALTFIRNRNPVDETAIISFSHSVQVEQPFTRDVEQLERGLDGIARGGSTRLYDAIVVASAYVERFAAHRKKVLVVISDGEDNGSRNSLKDVLKVIGEAKVTLYTVGLMSDGFAATYDNPRRTLKKLAEITGGRSFFPRKVKEIESICRQIADDLRNQYTIGYRPSNLNLDGSWRKVEVRLVPPEKSPRLTLRTKQGYYAPLRTSDKTSG